MIDLKSTYIVKPFKLSNMEYNNLTVLLIVECIAKRLNYINVFFFLKHVLKYMNKHCVLIVAV